VKGGDISLRNVLMLGNKSHQFETSYYYEHRSPVFLVKSPPLRVASRFGVIVNSDAIPRLNQARFFLGKWTPSEDTFSNESAAI
jgi:hypothetical protein